MPRAEREDTKDTMDTFLRNTEKARDSGDNKMGLNEVYHCLATQSQRAPSESIGSDNRPDATSPPAPDQCSDSRYRESYIERIMVAQAL
jgi:hypothetical protein